MSELLESSIWKLAIHLHALEEQSSRQGEETRACIVDIERCVPLVEKEWHFLTNTTASELQFIQGIIKNLVYSDGLGRARRTICKVLEEIEVRWGFFFFQLLET